MVVEGELGQGRDEDAELGGLGDRRGELRVEGVDALDQQHLVGLEALDAWHRCGPSPHAGEEVVAGHRHVLAAQHGVELRR